MNEPPVHLIGHRFPGGTMRVADHEAWLGHDAMGAHDLGLESLHPLWILVIALRGMGVTIEELVGLAGASTTSGVLFGELGWEQARELRANTEYGVSGAIVDVTRHRGKRAGTLDRLVFEVELREPDASLAARMTSSFLLSRRSESDDGLQ